MAKPTPISWLADRARALASMFNNGNLSDCVNAILEYRDPGTVALMTMLVAKELPRDQQSSLMVCFDNRRQEASAS